MGTRFFPGVKRPGRGADHPTPSGAELKERVELYLYSPSGPLWPVLGWTLPLHYLLWRCVDACIPHCAVCRRSLTFGSGVLTHKLPCNIPSVKIDSVTVTLYVLDVKKFTCTWRKAGCVGNLVPVLFLSLKGGIWLQNKAWDGRQQEPKFPFVAQKMILLVMVSETRCTDPAQNSLFGWFLFLLCLLIHH